MNLPADVAALIDAAAARHGVASAYARAVAWVESGGQQWRTGARGELGVMQLSPATAAYLNVDARSLNANVEGGVRYLAHLIKRYGVNAGIASYNAGPGRVGVRPEHEWPLSTREYVRTVLARAEYEAHTMGGRTAAAPFPREDEPTQPHPRCSQGRS